jgi:hypothetical protein
MIFLRGLCVLAPLQKTEGSHWSTIEFPAKPKTQRPQSSQMIIRKDKPYET